MWSRSAFVSLTFKSKFEPEYSGTNFLIERLSQKLSKKSLHSVSRPSSCNKPMTAKRWYFPRSESSSSW